MLFRSSHLPRTTCLNQKPRLRDYFTEDQKGPFDPEATRSVRLWSLPGLEVIRSYAQTGNWAMTILLDLADRIGRSKQSGTKRFGFHRFWSIDGKVCSYRVVPKGGGSCVVAGACTPLSGCKLARPRAGTMSVGGPVSCGPAILPLPHKLQFRFVQYLCGSVLPVPTHHAFIGSALIAPLLFFWPAFGCLGRSNLSCKVRRCGRPGSYLII